MAQAPRLEWWTATDAAALRSISGGWEICVGASGPDVLRARCDTDRPDRVSLPAPEPGPAHDLDGLWRSATGPARIETVHRDRVVATTTIDLRGDLTTHTISDATPELLALHADVVAAALSARAAGVARALAGRADAGLESALHAWFSAHCPEA